MTPVGHTIVGLAIGAIISDRYPTTRGKAAAILACVLAANGPDLPLPGWGHDRYDISHSIISLSFLIACASAVAFLWRRSIHQHRALLFCASIALLSHLLLDSFYNHGRGVRILWPIDTDYRLALPLPWFSLSGWNGFPPSADTVRVVAIEATVYGLLAVLAFALLRLLRRWRHDPPPS